MNGFEHLLPVIECSRVDEMSPSGLQQLYHGKGSTTCSQSPGCLGRALWTDVGLLTFYYMILYFKGFSNDVNTIIIDIHHVYCRYLVTFNNEVFNCMIQMFSELVL